MLLDHTRYHIETPLPGTDPRSVDPNPSKKTSDLGFSFQDEQVIDLISDIPPAPQKLKVACGSNSMYQMCTICGTLHDKVQTHTDPCFHIPCAEKLVIAAHYSGSVEGFKCPDWVMAMYIQSTL